MCQPKPFHRNYRGFKEGSNSGFSQWAYIVDREYAVFPEHYVRAFLLIQNDLQKLFEYVEPSDTNLDTFSYRIHELFVRTCIEVEANFKAILNENIYAPTDRRGDPVPDSRWNIHNYRIVDHTHHLSSYKIHVPIWEGNMCTFTPFHQWKETSELFWYQAYNKSKHDRKIQFRQANLRNLVNSVAGLLILLSSQFRTEDFSPGNTLLSVNVPKYYSTEPAIGGFFHIDFPNDWSEEEKYDFNWEQLKTEPDRFQKIDYESIRAAM